MNTEHRGSALRAGRFGGPGTAVLATTITRDREPLFLDAAAGQSVLDALRWLDSEGRIDLVAAVVMPDHFHTVLMMLNGELSAVMHSVKSYSANRVNATLRRSGAVWQKGYHESALRDEEQRLDALWYCVRNPVRAGLVADFHDYPLWFCKYPV